LVHNESFNVGQTHENYRIREVADIVCEVVPGSRVTYAPDGGPDLRCYRVDCGKLGRVVPQFQPSWTVRDGVEELYAAYQRADLRLTDIRGPRFSRISTIQRLLADGLLDEKLRWRGVGSHPGCEFQTGVDRITGNFVASEVR